MEPLCALFHAVFGNRAVPVCCQWLFLADEAQVFAGSNAEARMPVNALMLSRKDASAAKHL